MSFEISVSAYPECHPDSPNAQADLDNLKRKIDNGATRAITQFFFEPDTFFRFRDDAAKAGISAEIVPGIMPVMNYASVVRMSGMCGTDVPGWMERLFEGLDDHPAAALGDGRRGPELGRIFIPLKAVRVADKAAGGQVLQAAGAVPGALVVGVEDIAGRVHADAARGAHAAGGRHEAAILGHLARPTAKLDVAGERAGQT